MNNKNKELLNDPEFTPGPFSKEDNFAKSGVIRYMKRKKMFGKSTIPPREFNIAASERMFEILNEVFQELAAGHIHGGNPLTNIKKDIIINKISKIIITVMES